MCTAHQCTIIPLTQEHIEDVGRIDRLCFIDPWLKRSFIDELNAPCALNVVAVNPAHCHEMSGFCLGRVIADEYTLHRLAVHPSFQRRGIAACMLRQCMELAALKGARHCFVEVRAGNTVAQQLYRRCGFTLHGMRRAYYQPGAEDALLMQCDLAATHGFTSPI